ncbi:MAG TPA: ATP-binding cassette domain-containing protein [Vicinamibacteria bacterium]|nr:ATP-binding cassette domain-containing protein [Vicinamibacteria bacterium]
MALLELTAIRKDFPGVRALDGVSFDLQAGEVHALCGENGAGKSTLIKVLCGFFPSHSFEGEIRLDGRAVRFDSLRAGEEHGIALIAQELALVPELSVAENLLLGREPVRHGLIRWDVVRTQARRALDRVGLAIDPERPVRELGIGQQQLVEIAKALAKDARILVLDEPTAALTEADTERLLTVLRELRSRGVAAIYISHRLEEVFKIADRITVLRDGRSVGTERTDAITRQRVIALMVGRELKDLCPRPPAASGPVVLGVARWSVADPNNPGRQVVQDVNLEVRAGEVLGIGGLMGAGRTALLSSLFGAARSPVNGELRLPGRSSLAPFASPAEAIAAGLALVSEDRKRYGLLLEAAVGENLTLATLRRFVRHGLLDAAAQAREAGSQCASLRIKTPGLDALAGRLSGGNQQKIVLGKWLLAKPRVLLLDEPTRGIDVGAKAEIYDLVSRLAASGLAVLLVSSELPELLGLSHRILVLSQGRPTAELPADEATAERVMAAATASA